VIITAYVSKNSCITYRFLQPLSCIHPVDRPIYWNSTDVMPSLERWKHSCTNQTTATTKST